MASFFTKLKTFRPRRPILAEDANLLQSALEAAFNLLGEKPADGRQGVSTPFAAGDAVEPYHVVTKAQLDASPQSAVEAAASAAAALVSEGNAAASAVSASNSSGVATSAVASIDAIVAAADASIDAIVAQAIADTAATTASIEAIVAQAVVDTAAAATTAVGAYAVFSNNTATTDPTPNDDSANTSGNGTFQKGSEWINTQSKTTFKCVIDTPTAAVWVNMSAATGVATLIKYGAI